MSQAAHAWHSLLSVSTVLVEHLRSTDKDPMSNPHALPRFYAFLAHNLSADERGLMAELDRGFELYLEALRG